jgi:heme exporter protein A
MIVVNNLVKRFGVKTVLRGLNFEVQAGEFVALLGPNGSGKTTLMRILSSLTRPTSGRINVAGHTLPGQSSEVRNSLGVVSHQPLLYGDLTAEENLLFFGRMYGVGGLKKRIDQVLELVGLLARRRDLVRTYSRGMQQRLAIGRAILHDPQVLLFDEPHTGLDQGACAMLDSLLQEVAGQGRTILMTSHDLSRVESLASRFDVLSRGMITASVRRNDLAGNGLSDFYRKSLAA